MEKLYVVEQKEENEYDQFQSSNGYTRGSAMEVEVQGAVKTDLKVDIVVDVMTEESFQNIKKFAYENLNDQEKEMIEQSSSEGHASFFATLFGAKDGHKNSYKNTTRDVDLHDKKFQNALAKKLMDSEKGTYKITGNISISTTSYLPSKATVFVGVTKMKIRKGNNQRTIHVVDNSVVPASPDGTRDPNLTATGKLNIMPA